MVEDVAAFFASPQQKDIQDKDYSPVVPAAAERHQIPVNDRRQSIKGFSPSMDDEDTTRQNSPHLVDPDLRVLLVSPLQKVLVVSVRPLLLRRAPFAMPLLAKMRMKTFLQI
ncbi:hypothetical protein BC829DRAFT_37578 [Chytridium lagenaria]|nr:hypothetical protein BC829DRAFT_37578 [Chytridium lagenaria]